MSSETITIREFDFSTMEPSCTWFVVAPPGSGKCLAPGTPVITYDGRVVKVEDVKVFDFLMGDDSQPRRVLSTTSGVDDMYTVTPSVGDPYTVNGPHILCLMKNELNGLDESNILEISVLDYLKTPEAQRRCWRGYRRFIDFRHGMSFGPIPNLHRCQLKDAIYQAYAIDVQPKGQGPYHGFQISGNGRFILGDFTVTHNTTFIENMAYAVKHKYPVARVFAGTQASYNRFCKIFGSLYVTLGFNEEMETKHIRRQRICEDENGEGHPSNYALNILDDVSDDPKIFKSPMFNDIFKNGSQHYHQIFIIALQYAIDVPVPIRNAVSYIALFRELNEDNLEKLYRNFGGACQSKKKFRALMDQVTGDHTCLIIDKRSQSTRLEDHVFYYRTYDIEKKHPDWKFGCAEYREWNAARVDPHFKEPI